jgi:hypothetical protein
VAVEDITLDYGALIAGPVAVAMASMIALKPSKQPHPGRHRGHRRLSLPDLRVLLPTTDIRLENSRASPDVAAPTKPRRIP